MKKSFGFLYSAWFMGILFLVLIVSMAVATFLENDYGAPVARSVVYNTKWFEIIFFLLTINLLGQIFKNKLYKKKKIAVFLFHSAFIIIIIGAGITRYIGYEGSIHIREGETQNICLSSENFIQFEITDLDGNQLFYDDKEFISPVGYKKKYQKNVTVDGINYNLNYDHFLYNATETIIAHPEGEPILAVLITKGMMFRETLFIKKGDFYNLNGFLVGFNTDKDSLDVEISFEEEIFYIKTKKEVRESNMMTRMTTSHEKGVKLEFKPTQIYVIDDYRIIVHEQSPKGIIQTVTVNKNVQNTNESAIKFELAYGNKTEILFAWLGGNHDDAILKNGNHIIKVRVGRRLFKIPFSIKLTDFTLERYPGSNSPSSFKSDVILIDNEENYEKSFLIYMNNVLKYKGYRFYQSSYDQDEQGTILSVNYDLAGMPVTYIGYFILIISLILAMMGKHTLFRTVNKNFFNRTVKSTTILLLLILSSFSNVNANSKKLVVDKSNAFEFGKILIQDQSGRTEPLYTMSNDILRKVSRDTEYNTYNPMQVFMGILFDFENWKDEPFIKVSNKELQQTLGILSNYASFSDIVDKNKNAYKLNRIIQEVYSKPPGQRNKYDKEVIKLDERLNIIYMVYSGDIMRIFPVNNSSGSWETPFEAYKFGKSEEDSLYLKGILGLYAESLFSASKEENSEYLSSIINYQQKNAKYNLPNSLKINAEIFYYKFNIFKKLFPTYSLLGVLILIIFIVQIISGKNKMKGLMKILSYGIGIAFAFHTIGLIIRWYISGHAPMSNGYESMIFISWVTILAGFIFSKKSRLVLSATAVLASLTLMVANLSFMDPQITNLVPVLQSYWLTLHVSVITGSYGFLGLGAILGVITLILYALQNKKNSQRISDTIDDLTVINYKTMTLGLYFLTIGTFLGAIWANESWGRYWGWDPKETWSLITIIVYSFVIHSRMINSLKSKFAFNVMSLFAFFSVLMTYFGVNYYLSGLHSYAGGDSVPVPVFVYISVMFLIGLSGFAYYKYMVWNKPS